MRRAQRLRHAFCEESASAGANLVDDIFRDRQVRAVVAERYRQGDVGAHEAETRSHRRKNHFLDREADRPHRKVFDE